MSPNYTPEQAAQLRAEFAPVLAAYRHRRKLIVWIIVGVMAFFFSAILGSMLGITIPFASELSSLGFMCIGGAMVLSVLTKAMLKCPSCKLSLNTLGTYCPECGAAGLQPGTGGFWREPAHCHHCHRDMTVGNKGTRKYTVRGCSHCALFLDATGV